MNPRLKSLVLRAVPWVAVPYDAYRRIFKDPKSYLLTSGWYESFKQKIPLDGERQYIPWLTRAIIPFLEERLQPSMTLFEFGSGYSTPYYGRKVHSVVSVEYDPAWLERVQKMVGENVSLLSIPQDRDGDYCRAIQRTGKQFDVVVIDGRDRNNCIRQSIPCLTEGGIMLLDDAQRPAYEEGIAVAQEQGFRVLRFEGLNAVAHFATQTAVLYRDNNCFGL